MKDAERKLFDKMISHHIKSFTESDILAREYHHVKYQIAKHNLWNLQEEERGKNGKNT
jgi:hypothetical protein